jgi:glutamine phosphoribosylpyrophosphate amidotransferase
MCGIIGFQGIATPANISSIKDILLQLSYRGSYATGISYSLDGSNITTIKEKINAKNFLEKYNLDVLLTIGSELCLIGHTRYKTSGECNQPFHYLGGSIVMDGVIDQSDHLLWNSKYGSYFMGDNDVELLYQFMSGIFNNTEALSSEVDSASWAFVSIEKELVSGAYKLVYGRNSRRPLWASEENGLFICSTEDAFNRCGKINSYRVKPIGGQEDLQI